MKSFPPIFYGTAWKKGKTAELVELAIRSGFRAIDTACQPKHYNESGVGQGIQKSGIDRKDIFIQTKFTSFDGQDPNNIPYNPKDELKKQVRTSMEVSLKNLKTTYIDSLVLHGPLNTFEKTYQVWTVFEQFVKDGIVLNIGISNCYSPQYFKKLYEKAVVKPTFLQNRFYADTAYDQQLRIFCRNNQVHYQSFWTLTANPHILQSPPMRQLSKKYAKTPQQIFYMTLIGQGIIPLIGTTSKVHMEQDLEMLNLKLEQGDRTNILKMLYSGG